MEPVAAAKAETDHRRIRTETTTGIREMIWDRR
jgi:hypothetical protein